jgi:hypothetical protein
MLEQETNPRRKTILTKLHQWSIGQFQRLFTIHLSMQSRLQHFCEERRILLTFKVLDQALDLTVAPVKRQIAETIAPAK